MPNRKLRKKKAGKKKLAGRKRVRRGTKTAPRKRLARSKIPGGGASAQIHQGTGPAPASPSEITPNLSGDASNQRGNRG
jgi:hypothetical protein